MERRDESNYHIIVIGIPTCLTILTKLNQEVSTKHFFMLRVLDYFLIIIKCYVPLY